jgi:hypothetical protein
MSLANNPLGCAYLRNELNLGIGFAEIIIFSKIEPSFTAVLIF